MAKLLVKLDPECVDPDDTLIDFGPGGGDCDSIVVAYYYHTDHLGTPWYMTGKSKGIVWKGDYMPFGELYAETGSQTNLHRFPGQYKEQNTLYYNWNRWYAPKIGRYLQADPIGLVGGTNLYSYTINDPIRRIDPDALAWFRFSDGFQWYGKDFVGPVPGLFSAENFYDYYSDKRIDPKEQDYFIPDASDVFASLFDQSFDLFNQWPMQHNYLVLSVAATGCFDIKERSDLPFGRGFNLYSAVNGVILQNQDWGNVLFGAYSRTANFLLPEIKIGAGAYQIYKGNSKLSYYKTFFDDPRDAYFISLGYNSFSNVIANRRNKK